MIKSLISLSIFKDTKKVDHKKYEKYKEYEWYGKTKVITGQVFKVHLLQQRELDQLHTTSQGSNITKKRNYLTSVDMFSKIK